MSHETIYRSLYVQARGVLKKELLQHLRSRRPIRRSRHATQKGRHIVNAVSIRERPASVEDRAVPGHWEGDLLCGSKNSNIVTLVERHSRYVMLAKVPNRETQTVVNALIKQARKAPGRTLQVADLGSRARNSPITSASPWKPTSPFTSAIRRALGSAAPTKTPTDCCDSTSLKGTDLSAHSQAQLNYIARELNERPRKTLGLPVAGRTISAPVLRRPVEVTPKSGRSSTT